MKLTAESPCFKIEFEKDKILNCTFIDDMGINKAELRTGELFNFIKVLSAILNNEEAKT